MKEIEKQEKIRLEKVQRKERAIKLSESLPPEPTGTAINIKARLPESIVSSRKFEANTKLSVIFDWAESLLGDSTPPSENCQLEIVQSLRPGQNVVYTRQENGESSLSQLEFARTENLNFRWKITLRTSHNPSSFREELLDEQKFQSKSSSLEWEASRLNAESSLDHSLRTHQEAAIQDNGDKLEDLVSTTKEMKTEMNPTEMFKFLLTKGSEPISTAQACQKYLPAFILLKNLNLLEDPHSGAKAVEIVERFKGSTSRIVDAMLNNTSSSSVPTASTPSPPPQDFRYQEQLTLLESMFTDKNRNEILQALEKHRGSVERAANELLS